MEEDDFVVEGEFIFHSYSPVKLAKGMKFLTHRLPHPDWYFFTLQELPEDEEAFMVANGAPMTVNIITTGEDGEIIALHDEIGLFDSGNDTPLREITDYEMNEILNMFGGIMNIEADETGDPILYDGKVIISYLALSENDEEL